MDIEQLLGELKPQVEERWVWGEGTLPIRVQSYATEQVPPQDLITSVRCVVVQDQTVLVVGNENGRHIIPGGRVESGESYEHAVRRELFEETGWAVGKLTYLGFLYLEHQAPKPEGYRFPYPHFFQLIYRASAVSRHMDRRIADDYETTSQFVPFSEALALEIDSIQKFYIERVCQ